MNVSFSRKRHERNNNNNLLNIKDKTNGVAVVVWYALKKKKEGQLQRKR